MTRSLAIKIGSACITSSALLDPVRITIQALALRKARSAHPELFDGAKALVEIELAIKDSTR
jgi:hypothetical protein